MSEKSEQQRLSVFKTYKLYVGGKFPRSESGRVYEVTDSKGNWLANAPLSSRKDARDAVVAARKAFGGWSGATAYNRGQILYRVAEMLEGRREQFVREVADAEGLSQGQGRRPVVDAAIDRWVWYAGWTDKIAQVVGRRRTRSRARSSTSPPRSRRAWSPSWPRRSRRFLGLVSVLAPVIATGNTAVVIAAREVPAARAVAGRGAGHLRPARRRGQRPVRPDGGDRGRRSPPTRTSTRSTWPGAGRRRPGEGTGDRGGGQPQARPASTACGRLDGRPGHDRLTAFLETKTVWHPTGVAGRSGSSY